GLLMVYNMGNLRKFGTHNSILDPADTRRYLSDMASYPLPLDIALPVFRWGVLFEGNRFTGILYDLGKDDFPAGTLRLIQGNLFEVAKKITIRGYSLDAGQVIRFEAPTYETLRDISHYIAPRRNQDSTVVSLFHLDSASLSNYTTEALRDIFECY